MNPWPHTGAVLIGGRSSRMGTPKYALRLADGRTMIEHVLNAMEATCAKVVLVGVSAEHAAPRHLTSVPDTRPGQGPLAAVEALLASGLDAGGEYLVCPCDVPLMLPEALTRLIQPSLALATVFRIEGRDEPESLPARISERALPAVGRLLDSGQRAIWALIKSLPAEIVTAPSEFEPCFANVNTPEDFDRLWPTSTG